MHSLSRCLLSIANALGNFVEPDEARRLRRGTERSHCRGGVGVGVVTIVVTIAAADPYDRCLGKSRHRAERRCHWGAMPRVGCPSRNHDVNLRERN